MVVVEVGQRLLHRVTSAELRLLPRPRQVGGIEALAHHLPTVAIHHADALRVEGARGVEHVGQHRLAGDGLEDLGQHRAHALALAGSENDDLHG